MRTIILIVLITTCALMGSCEKDKTNSTDVYGEGPRTGIPVSLEGNWMYGMFSMTEYWSQNPADYIGNAFEMAIAFKFYAKGTYDQYFTSKTVSGGLVTYHRSVTKGTVVLNEADKTITIYAKSAHYKQTRNGVTTEDRDLAESEITKVTTYAYELVTGNNGARSIYLKLNGTGNALQFVHTLK